jgi:hypothetical protein
LEEDITLFGEVAGGAWDVNLGFSAIESDVEFTTGDALLIRRWVEDVANFCTLVGETLSRWLERYIVSGVGQSNEEVSSVVSVNIVENVFFFLWMIPNLMSFSSSVNFGGHLIDIIVGVHVLPEGFSVVWIITPGIVLFRTVVVEWNTSSGQSKGKSRFESNLVVILVQESSVVVVINENT